MRKRYRIEGSIFYVTSNIYTEEFLKQKLNYIHLNPVRAGLCTVAADHPYSSYRNYFLGSSELIEIDTEWNPSPR